MSSSSRWSLAAALLLAACAPATPAAPKVDVAAEEAAIRARVTEWNGFLQAKNDSAIAALYGTRGALMPANMPKLSGDAIRPFWAQLWAMNVTLTITTVNVTVAESGDLALEEGSYTFAVPTMPTDTGKYLVTWYKEGGKWMVAQDIWNSDLPPVVPTTK
jgi:ketosteroid isomerase-like protein